MLKKIRAKMESHLISILEKPIITNEEYMLLNGYLTKLEMEKAQEEMEKNKGENDKRLRALMEYTLGGADSV